MAEQVKLVISAEVDKAVANLKKVQGQLGKLDKETKDSSKTVDAFKNNWKSAALVIAGAALAFNKTIQAASDLEEVTSKFNVVFDDVAGAAEDMAKELQDSFGLGVKTSKELLSNTGDLLSGFGATGAEALELSGKVQRLAVDLASFTNVQGGAKFASEALTKAMLGEREQVKQLGIVITETAVKEKILELQKKGLIFETKQQAKAEAALQIAMEQSQNAMGDYERTQDSFANQSRLLSERLDDLAAVVGQALLPIITDIVAFTTSLVEGFLSLNPELRSTITTFGLLSAAVLVAAKALKVLGISMKTSLPILAAIGLAIGALIAVNELLRDKTFENAQALNAETTALLRNEKIIKDLGGKANRTAQEKARLIDATSALREAARAAGIVVDGETGSLEAQLKVVEKLKDAKIKEALASVVALGAELAKRKEMDAQLDKQIKKSRKTLFGAGFAVGLKRSNLKSIETAEKSLRELSKTLLQLNPAVDKANKKQDEFSKKLRKDAAVRRFRENMLELRKITEGATTIELEELNKRERQLKKFAKRRIKDKGEEKEALLAIESEFDDRRAEILERRREEDKGATTLFLEQNVGRARELSSALQAVFDQDLNNKLIGLDKENKAREQQIEKDFEARRQDIIKNVTDEKKRKTLLAQLDKEEEAAKRNLAAETDKKKKSLERAAAVRQKAFALTAALISTFEATAKALTAGPIVGQILAGITAALGAVQVGLIAAQPIPAAQEGGLIPGSDEGQIVRVGEAGRSEAIIPLENDRAQEALEGLGGGQTVINVNIENFFNEDEELPREIAQKIDQALFDLRRNDNATSFEEQVA